MEQAVSAGSPPSERPRRVAGHGGDRKINVPDGNVENIGLTHKTHQRPVLSHGRRFRRRTAARNWIPVTIWVAPVTSPTPIRAAT